MSSDLLALTADLVDRPSESFLEAPFVDFLEGELRSLAHLDVVRVGDNLVGRTNLGRSQRVLLAGHSDTVPANGNGTARIEGDVLWGLGSADMKGGLAVMLALAWSLPAPELDVTYLFYAREEVAQEHNGLNELARERPDLLEAGCAILGEPTSGVIEAGCQGAMRFEVTLAGVRAHTARPWMGRNAVHRLAPVLSALAAYETRQPVIDGCEFREALEAVSVAGGVAGNVVPDEARLRVHHRYAPDRSADEAEAFVRDLLAPHLDTVDQVEVIDSSPACLPSLDHPVLQRLAAGAEGQIRAKLGWTDVARFAALGVPATNFGPGDPTLAHAPSEHIDRASLETCHSALKALLTGAAQRSPG